MNLEKELKSFEKSNPDECAYYTKIDNQELSLTDFIVNFDRGCIMCDGRDKECKYYFSNGPLRKMYQESFYLDTIDS